MMIITKAVIYARKSTESEDRQVLSISSQIKELKAFALKQSIAVDSIMIESKSAKAPGRPVFDELFRRVQKSEVDAILCWKLDRLARNPLDGGALIWALDQGQLQRIITPSTSYSNSGSDKFLMQLEFGMAKKYVDDLSDNVRRGMRAKTESGWLPHLAPFGYLNDKARKIIVKDPKRFPLVRRMWDLMLTGSYTPTQIADIATHQWGVKSRRKRDNASTGLSRSAMYDLFSNPFYYGMIVRADQSVIGKHPPMITKHEFDRVQRLLGRVDRPRAKRHSFTYTGLFKCGNCGCSITAEEKTKRLTTTNNIARYVYYHCGRRKSGIICREPAITERQLEDQLRVFLNRIQLPRPYAEWVLQRLHDLENEELQKDMQVVQSTAKRLKQIENEISALLDLRLKTLLTDAEFVAKKKALEDERLTLQSSSTKHRKIGVSTYIARLVNFANTAIKAFDSGDTQVRRSIINAVCSNCALSSGKLVIQPLKPLSVLISGSDDGNAASGVLEPAKIGYPKLQNSTTELENPVWSTRLNDVRTWVREHPEEIAWLQTLHEI